MSSHPPELSTPKQYQERSWWVVGRSLIEKRRLILTLAIIGGLVGGLSGILSTRKYVAKAVFLPQAAEGTGLGGLAAAASQFGIRVANTGGAWGPLVYVEILRSRALLERLLADSIQLTEGGGRKAALLDLLGAKGSTVPLRTAAGVRALRKVVDVRDLKQLAAVQITVVTKWPSASQQIAEKMIQSLNQFNVSIRQSQALAERTFVEERSAEAQRLLRESEDRMQSFLQRNRTVSSPELLFERDRLTRSVTLRQAVYSSLMQNLEDARIREVRDTPVITVIEDPRIPHVPESRRTLTKGTLGLLAGAGLAALVIGAQLTLASARSASPEAEEFCRTLSDVARRRRQSVDV